MRKLFLLAIGILFSLSTQAQVSSQVSTQMSTNDTSAADKLGWQLALHSYTFQKFPISDAIDMTRALGVKYMSISGTVLLDGKRIGTLTLADQQRATIDQKLKADGFGNFVNMGVVKLPADEAECRKVFEFAKRWGIGTLVSEPETNALDTVEKLCKEYNIRVAIHNHPKGHSIYWSPDFVLAAITGRTPLMGACADVGHWLRSGLDPLECLKKLDGHIICLHFKDLNEMGPNAHDVPWGTGVGKTKELMAELKRQHFHGAFCVEYEYHWENSSPEIAQCVRFFNKTCDELVASNEATPAYRRADLPVDQRVGDLLGRMTLEEKVRQLDMYYGCQDLLDKKQTIDNHTHAKPDAVFDPQFAERHLGYLGAGSIHDLYPSAKLYNTVQSWVIQSSRLGIPALFLEEGLHGYMGYDQTVFPQSVNLAASWNPDLARKTGAAIAAETRAHGVDMILAPVLDVARDPRWGRVEEDFGEDPFLSGQLGLAYVRGMQGDSLATDHNVIAEPKHFAAHGSSESGLNSSPVHAGEREVRSIMLKSFEPSIREGNAMGMMAAYHDIDGVPCTGNPWLMNKVLRDEWGFKGFVLSDLGAIRRLYDTHHVAATPRAAVQLALNSGVDMQFYDFDHATFQNAIIDGIKNGQVSPATLEAAVSRILRVKFLLGLFEHPFVDENLDKTVRRSQSHLDLSLEVARQSMCLLKNQNNLLPLKKDLQRIAVIGPNANTTRLGDYADVAKESSAFGMLEQIKKTVSPQTKVSFSDGENIRSAVALAKNADTVILALGEKKGISGEGHDRSELDLPGNQEALLEAVQQTGVPVILVLQNGRALTIPWAAAHVPAILEAWYPGEFGGRAIAETLFGDINPAARLPVTFPKRVGQLPVFYNHFPSKGKSYVDGDAAPQFVFGFGLSYTTFKYDHLIVTPPAAGSSDDIIVSFDLKNTGNRDGDEVAQVYLHQTTASVATPVKELKGFSRVHLQAGETQHLALHIKKTDLTVWSAAQEWKTEAGEYTVMVGGSSAGDLSAKFNIGQPDVSRTLLPDKNHSLICFPVCADLCAASRISTTIMFALSDERPAGLTSLRTTAAR